MGSPVVKVTPESPDGAGSSAEKGGAERRRFARVKLLSPLYGHLVSGDLSFVVREASAGGFSLVASKPFAVNASHVFRFEIPSGQSATVLARCRYSTQAHREGEPPSYVSGFEFLPQPTQNLRLILGAIATDAP